MWLCRGRQTEQFLNTKPMMIIIILLWTNPSLHWIWRPIYTYIFVTKSTCLSARHEDIWRKGGVAPLFLDLNTRRRWKSALSIGKEPPRYGCALKTRLGGQSWYQGRYRRLGKRKISCLYRDPNYVSVSSEEEPVWTARLLTARRKPVTAVSSKSVAVNW